jgi:hypothetical protein
LGDRDNDPQYESESTFDNTSATAIGFLLWGKTNTDGPITFRYDAAVNALAQSQLIDGRLSEEVAFQLLGLSWAETTGVLLQPAAEELLARQNIDGGWSSSPLLGSDAYATGQAIYALLMTNQVTHKHSSIRRGIGYLLTSQFDDGSWYMRRRAFPFQPTMDPVFPHGRDGWISTAATSWAVLGCAATLDSGPTLLTDVQKAIARREALAVRHADLNKTSLPAPSSAKANFLDDIEPMLQSSCIGCHNTADKAGMYDMESRENLIKGGISGPPVVVPGNSAASLLIHHVSGQVEDVEMPPKTYRHDYPVLTDEEIGKLRAWIDQGLPGLAEESP